MKDRFRIREEYNCLSVEEMLTARNIDFSFMDALKFTFGLYRPKKTYQHQKTFRTKEDCIEFIRVKLKEEELKSQFPKYHEVKNI